MSTPRPPVYWLEADEEASSLAPETKATIGRRSLLAYLLLGRSVIAHPADFWQSLHTNELVLNKQALPLLKDSIQIHLGDSATIRDYMIDRIDKLRRDSASSRSNVELHQYERFGGNLTSQSDILDDVFTRSGATFHANESRDRKFRRLIREDLQDGAPYGPHLASCIRQGLGRRDADRFLKTLEELAHDRRRFISIDGIASRLTDAGCPKWILDTVFRRLQVLHWESRGEGLIELPLLSRTVVEKLDSSDPSVFWSAADHLLGRDFQRALMTLPWQTAIMITLDLRKDPTWTRFLDTYHVIVDTVEREHAEIVSAIVTSKLRTQYPTKADILWSTKPDKWTVLSWVCHAGSWLAGTPTGLGLVFRVGSGIAAVKRGCDHMTKVVKALFDSDRQVIAMRVRKMIEDATKTK